MSKTKLGRYSNQTINTIETYCRNIQVSLIDQINDIIEEELSKCKDHPTEREIRLFSHSLLKRIISIKYL